MNQQSNSLGHSQPMDRCDCCGGVNHFKVTQKRGYNIRLCNNCGLIFVFPQPTNEELERLYSFSEGYFATAEADLAKVSPESAIRINKMLQGLDVRPGRFLDVGCATGHLIYHMQKMGWEVIGNDLNDDALGIARHNGLTVVQGTLEQCDFDSESFDAIHLGDLIEHVRSPRLLSEEIYRILRPGGIISIVTPNAACGFASSTLGFSRLTGFAWAHSQAPYHLYEFQPKTLVKLLEDVGFKIEILTCQGGGSFPYIVGATGYFDKFKQEMKRDGGYQLNSQFFKIIPKVALVSGIIFPFWLWGRIIDAFNADGFNIHLVARRPQH